MTSFTKVFWLLTWRCNNRCKYCFQACKGFAKSPERIDEAIELLKRLKVRYVNFFGGEPLLEYRALRYISIKLHGYLTLGITTNGRLISPEIAKFFKENDFHVLVSCDGIEEAHNMFRQGWHETVTGIHHLGRANVPFAVAMTCHPKIVPLIPRGVKYLHETLGVRKIFLNPCKFIEEPYDVGLLRKMFKEVQDYCKKHADLLIPKVSTLKSATKLRSSCGAGRGTFNILPDGRLSLCQVMTDVIVGDVEKGPDLQILNEWASKEYIECYLCPVGDCAACHVARSCVFQKVRWEVCANT